MPVDGLLALPWYGVLAITLLLTHITIVAVTIYLHRHQAHRALELRPVIAHFFRFWLWMTTGMVTRQWVAIHRKHHAFCETPDDPHSPQVLGLRKVLWQGAELYQRAARDQALLARYGQGTPDDWLERHVYSAHDRLGVSLMLIIDVALFGPLGLSVWAVQMLWVPFWAAGVINGIAHFWGYRNYECKDAATNIIPWGILIAGEELHNNHHTYAASAKLSSKWWEFDIGWMYIRMLTAVGLAQVKKVARRPKLGPEKGNIDMETLKSVIQNRFQVLALYSREVIARVNRIEKSRCDTAARALLHRARRLLVRETCLLDEHSKQRLAQILASNKHLQTVYEFKLRLQALWQERERAPSDHLLQRLQEWCKQAEATGIEALQEFARGLQRYRLAAQA
ncbi:MAG: transposase [Gammaproteobacteria bacterium]|nr:transposase [Gammaproteobacteria bacterium]